MGIVTYIGVVSTNRYVVKQVEHRYKDLDIGTNMILFSDRASKTKHLDCVNVRIIVAVMKDMVPKGKCPRNIEWRFVNQALVQSWRLADI